MVAEAWYKEEILAMHRWITILGPGVYTPLYTNCHPKVRSLGPSRFSGRIAKILRGSVKATGIKGLTGLT